MRCKPRLSSATVCWPPFPFLPFADRRTQPLAGRRKGFTLGVRVCSSEMLRERGRRGDDLSAGGVSTLVATWPSSPAGHARLSRFALSRTLARTHGRFSFSFFLFSFSFSDAAAPARGLLAGLLLPVLFLLSSEGSGPPLSPSVSAPCRLRRHLRAPPRPRSFVQTCAMQPPTAPTLHERRVDINHHKRPSAVHARPYLRRSLPYLRVCTYRPSCTLRESHRHHRPCPLVFRELLVFDVGHPMLLSRARRSACFHCTDREGLRSIGSSLLLPPPTPFAAVVLPRSMNANHRLKITAVRASRVIFREPQLSSAFLCEVGTCRLAETSD